MKFILDRIADEWGFMSGRVGEIYREFRGGAGRGDFIGVKVSDYAP